MPVEIGKQSGAAPAEAPRSAPPESPASAPAWPEYRALPSEHVNANQALVMVLADGTTTELVQMDYAKAERSRAPGFEPSPLTTAVDEFDTGLFYVDLLTSGFDLDGNGLADAVVGISGGGNLCEYNGAYYVVFALPNGRAVSSASFGGCSVFASAAMTKAGLDVRFLDGERHLALPGLPPPYEPPPPKLECVSRTFFDNYARHGLVVASTESFLVLELPVDLHQTDCGAPDCYGHTMMLTLDLSRDAAACKLVKASASGNTFGPGEETPREWTNTFTWAKPIDLASPELERVELRDPKRREAVLLLRNGYFFFENVDARSKLIPALASDEDTDCCYGYTSSAHRGWR